MRERRSRISHSPSKTGVHALVCSIRATSAARLVERNGPSVVIAGLVPATSIAEAPCHPHRDGRNKSGHDSLGGLSHANSRAGVVDELLGRGLAPLRGQGFLGGQEVRAVGKVEAV